MEKEIDDLFDEEEESEEDESDLVSEEKED